LALLVPLLCFLSFRVAAAPESPAYTGPSNAELDNVREWFWDHPPDGKNAPERREKMAVIQAAADQFPAVDANRYMVKWSLSPRAMKPLEKKGAPYYLRHATDHAIKDLRHTRVTHGLVVWHLYNMGYVFKTPDATFGIDICLPDASRLAKDLDFLLISHNHNDHFAGGLAGAMATAGKPVVSAFFQRGAVVNEPADLQFGVVRVKVRLGDHSRNNPRRRDDMLMFQVECGPNADHRVIYHSGDGANYEKMNPDRPVDLFIPHVACSGMKVADAIRHVNPKWTLVSHVLELTHGIGGARWTYEYAFHEIGDLPESQATVLTWGERLVLPGTTFTPDQAR